jgi:predicted transcriptional regulator
MKEDFPLKGEAVEVKFKIEKDLAEKLKKMSEFSKYSESEIANTAIKRFVATHSDFLPRKK